MALLVILLLTSGCVTFCSQIYREYHLVNTPQTWSEAQSYCRNSYTDLATIGNHNDMQKLVNMVAASGVTTEVWVGLEETGPSSWLWSVGETQISDGVVNYTNWESLPNSIDNCGGMRNDGKWFNAPCTTTLPYVCQDLATSLFDVPLQNKSWIDAQLHCRINNRDLASARSQTENLVLKQVISGISLSSVWIGLFRDEWKWSDRSKSSFRYWARGQPNYDGTCLLYNPSLKGFMDRECTYPLPFICHNVSAGMKQFKFNVKVTMTSSFDLNDTAVSKAILKQIQSKYRGPSVQWRVPSDGNIFSKKEERTIKDTC